MGLFDLFKSKNRNEKNSTANQLPGPTYLEGFIAPITESTSLEEYEWRKLISLNGQTKFRLRYYGQLHATYNNLIVRTEFSRPLIVAVDVVSEQEILLWDGCMHGYDPIFCESFSPEQLDNRKPETIYKDADGETIFEICVSTYNQFDYDEAMGGEVDEDGYLDLGEGRKIKFDEAKRNGFDFIGIFIINVSGTTTAIVAEELA
jgi:hypothetical protein